MGEVVNLRRARKAQARRQDEAQAQDNRVRHGLSKAERSLAEARRAKAAQLLDGHRLDSGETESATEKPVLS
jgi:hypothetical protein